MAEAIQLYGEQDDDAHTKLYTTAVQLGQPVKDVTAGIKEESKRHRPGNIKDYDRGSSFPGITTLRRFVSCTALDKGRDNVNDLFETAETSSPPVTRAINGLLITEMQHRTEIGGTFTYGSEQHAWFQIPKRDVSELPGISNEYC